MGCAQTKVEDKKLATNGNTITALIEPSAPPPTDNRLPLNAREVFRIKKSWKGIHRKMQETGVEMFARYVSVCKLCMRPIVI